MGSIIYCPTNKCSTSAQGQWGPEERNLHINNLELLAVSFVLRSLFSNESCLHIRIKSDNTSVVSCIHCFGTCHSPELHNLSRTIWLWCYERKIWRSAEHIRGVQNSIADKLFTQVQFKYRVDDRGACFRFIDRIIFRT